MNDEDEGTATVGSGMLVNLSSLTCSCEMKLRLAILRGMESCVFCRVAEGATPARVLFADDEVVAFHDIAPRAPIHVVVIPRRHITSLASAGGSDRDTLGRLLLAAAEVARLTGIAETGYRVVTNSGPEAGQSVFHLHLHVLGGRAMGWPPG